MLSGTDAARGAVVIIVVIAAWLRVWGLSFGFPHVLAQPDEVRVVHTGVEFLSGRLDPGFFNYPTLFIVIVIQESPLVSYSSVSPALREWLTRYELRSTVRAFDERQVRVYDQQDAFFLPLANFDRIARPGPNIFVYVRGR